MSKKQAAKDFISFPSSSIDMYSIFKWNELGKGQISISSKALKMQTYAIKYFGVKPHCSETTSKWKWKLPKVITCRNWGLEWSEKQTK